MSKQFTPPISLGLPALVEAYKQTTFNIDPEPQPADPSEAYQYDFTKPEDITRFYANNGVFAVGKFNARNYTNFQNHFGLPLDKLITMWQLADLYDALKEFPELQGDDNTGFLDGVSYDAETNTYTTPIGKLEGAPYIIAMEILAFILSQYGRVTDLDARGNYVLEDFSSENLLEIINPEICYAQVPDSPQNLFQTVLKLIRGFAMSDLEAEIEPEAVEEGAPKPKNSRRSKKDVKSTISV